METSAIYEVHATAQPPELRGAWDGPVWAPLPAAAVAQFRPESTAHRPRTLVKLAYDAGHIYGLFRVEDRYVRSVTTTFNGPVCRDSCVEFFVQPGGRGGYFNFEFNAGGALHVSFVTDPTRVKGGFKRFAALTPAEGAQVRIYHSLPAVIEPERPEPTLWFLEFAIPLALLAPYGAPPGPLAGQQWRANFYKCGDATSHPHWASWAPLTERNFHLPRCFGTLRFV